MNAAKATCTAANARIDLLLAYRGTYRFRYLAPLHFYAVRLAGCFAIVLAFFVLVIEREQPEFSPAGPVVIDHTQATALALSSAEIGEALSKLPISFVNLLRLRDWSSSKFQLDS